MPNAAQHKNYDDPLIRFKDQEPITGIGRTTAYAYIRLGLMPAPIKLGPRACGWRLSTLTAWLNERERAKTQR